LVEKKKSNVLKRMLGELESVNAKLEDLCDGLALLMDMIDEYTAVLNELVKALTEEGVKLKVR